MGITDDPIEYLTTFLNRTLRIRTTDNREFIGQMKCVDRGCNVILDMTSEVRLPSEAENVAANELARSQGTKVIKRLESRFVGLVSVPGKHIVSVACEMSSAQAVELGLVETPAEAQPDA